MPAPVFITITKPCYLNGRRKSPDVQLVFKILKIQTRKLPVHYVQLQIHPGQ